MKPNKIKKISISLLIALAFILPSGAVMAKSYEGYAGETNDASVIPGDIMSQDYVEGWPVEVSGGYLDDYTLDVSGTWLPEGTYNPYIEISRPDYTEVGTDWTLVADDDDTESDMLSSVATCDDLIREDGTSYSLTTLGWGELELEVTTWSETNKVQIKLNNPAATGGRWDDSSERLLIYRDYDDDGVVDWVAIEYQDGTQDFLTYDGATYTSNPSQIANFDVFGIVGNEFILEWTASGPVDGKVAGAMQEYYIPTSQWHCAVVPCAAGITFPAGTVGANPDDTSAYLAEPGFQNLPITIEMKADCDNVYFRFISSGAAIDALTLDIAGAGILDAAAYATLGTNIVEFAVPRGDLPVGPCNENGFAFDYTASTLTGIENTGTVNEPIVEELVAFDCPGTVQVKAFAELYVKSFGDLVTMYETSFEDNFDIYNNWVQIDGDCGITDGFFDTWDWSDARASDGDHSMKSTMYDVYKGNQNDILEFTNMGEPLNISDQDRVNVSFDIWVDGQGDVTYGELFDYLTFQVRDGSTWFTPYFVDSHGWPVWYDFTTTDMSTYDYGYNMTGFVRDLGGGWWHVWYDAPVAGFINPEDVGFRFVWTTDPQQQFEGAYVDNFKIISVENMETKVDQTHSQGPFTFDDESKIFKFPLPFDFEDQNGIKEDEPDYDLLLWIEVLDDCHRSLNDYPDYVDYPIYIGDYADCMVTSLTLSDTFLNEGDDLYIDAEIEVQGTLSASNIAVKASAQKMVTEEVYSTSFESLPWSDTVNFGPWYGLNPNFLWHQTDVDAYTGAKSLGHFNKDTGHYENDEYIQLILGPTIDLSPLYDVKTGEVIGDGIMSYYAKWITEETYDYWLIRLSDPTTNYVLGCGADYSGYNPEWTPMEFNLMGYWDYWHSVRGMYTNPDGTPYVKTSFGFSMDNTDSSVYYNELAESHGQYWSGVFIDDVSVEFTYPSGEEVWSDTVIVPGPLGVNEDEQTAEVDFEWEDVPFCSYLITVETMCEEACNNHYNDKKQAEIMVADELEFADDFEGFDYTNVNGGEWGICSSDYDNYLSTNPTDTWYPESVQQIVQLSPDHGEDCDIEDAVMDVSHLDWLVLDFDAWWELEDGWDFVYLETSTADPPEDYFDWSPIAGFSGYQTTWTHVTIPIDVSGTDVISIRLRLDSDIATTYRGFIMDDLHIADLFDVTEVTDESPQYEDFDDPMDNMDNWCIYSTHYGQNWNEETGCQDPIPVAPIDNALIWETEILDSYMAWLNVDIDWNPIAYDNNFGYGFSWWPNAELEISADGGVTYKNLYRFSGLTPENLVETFDISEFSGNDLIIRLRVTAHDGGCNIWDANWLTSESMGDWYWINYISPGASGGSVCVNEMTITGKTDDTAPISTATMSGSMTDAGWYSTPVQVTITATDDNQVKEIHYILDGSETVVAGDRASFTVSGNGAHNLEFWAIDQTGNVETPHNTVPTFRIDSGSPPTVAITAPEPGLYLFGNKLLSLSKVMIIGAFTAEATASDAESGVYRVQFLLDGDVVAEDTEAPFSAYIAEKHMGAGTLSVVAEDFSGNTAEDSLDITYYKFL